MTARTLELEGHYRPDCPPKGFRITPRVIGDVDPGWCVPRYDSHVIAFEHICRHINAYLFDTFRSVVGRPEAISRWMAVCDGGAHSNPFIDHCGQCLNWHWGIVPKGRTS